MRGFCRRPYHLCLHGNTARQPFGSGCPHGIRDRALPLAMCMKNCEYSGTERARKLPYTTRNLSTMRHSAFMRHSALPGVIVTLATAISLMGACGCSSSSTLQPPVLLGTGDGGAGGTSPATGGETVASSSTSTGGTPSQGGEPATGGATAIVCLATETKCNGACVDLTSDTANCGECGSACTATQVCSGGQCVCPPENPDACGPRCVNLQSTTTDCGQCYQGCSPLRCIAGTCACATTDITCKNQ